MTSSWMVVAAFLFATMAVFVKLGSQYFGAAELAFYRSLVTMVVAFICLSATRGTVRTGYLAMHAIRGLVGALAIICYFYSISSLSLATAQTLYYTSPLFIAIATTVVLRERPSRWLVAAVALGFVGVALLLQPHFDEGKEVAVLAGVLGGMLAAWAYLSVRTLGRLGEPDWRVVFWYGAFATVFCAVWQGVTSSFHPVTRDNWWMLLGLGVCGALAQWAVTRAYRTGNTLVVGALLYSSIVFAALFTYVLWNDRLGALEWAGIAVIIASGILAMRAGKRMTK
ncbi:MAG: DMT family transporter [Usitatibacter sp.]